MGQSDVYDPLAKDTDNDGIADRYDNAFQDSDYRESTYDVEGARPAEPSPVEARTPKKRRLYRSAYKRSNFSGDIPTRDNNSTVDGSRTVDTERQVPVSEKESMQALRESAIKGKDLSASKKLQRQKIKQKQLQEVARKKAAPASVQSELASQVQGAKRIKDSADTATGAASKAKQAAQGRYSSKLKRGGKAQNTLLLSGAFGVDAVRDYLRSGSDENAGVEAGEKTAGASSKLIHQAKEVRDKRNRKSAFERGAPRLSNRKASKLEFKKELVKLKADPDYQKAGRYKKFLKRRQMKSMVAKKTETRVRDRIKHFAIGTFKSAKEFVARRAKGILGLLLGIFLLGSVFMTLITTLLGGVTNGSNGVLTTTYLSDQPVLTNVNESFSSMEYSLQEELENVESTHPGFDEYIINKEGDIGHDTHMLLSYITSRVGVVEQASDVEGILEELFDRVYEITYDEVTEIRTRWVEVQVTDADGNVTTELQPEQYEYKKLIVTLHKKDMDGEIRQIFADYPDNVTHYEALLETKGNMADVFGSTGDPGEVIANKNFGNPGIAFDDATVQQLFNEAEKHIGKRYVFGASGPSNFDCSGFVCWAYTKSGVANMPRTTAWGIYKNYCTPIAPSEAKAGDIIFFGGTYNSGSPISHVGIYAGNGMMLHAGDPIQYTSINLNYWQSHFYSFGRPN
ncbi:MAG: C40 family peptidase [Dialister sp.]|nr:C40 family peptidase [Dialister sp.]